MNAITSPALLTIASAFSLPALSPVHQTIPFVRSVVQLSDDLTVSQTETGLIIWREQSPIVWIYVGYHEGQSDKQPKRCDFVDVAYHRQTTRGINLETADFLNLDDALHFIADVFGGEL